MQVKGYSCKDELVLSEEGGVLEIGWWCADTIPLYELWIADKKVIFDEAEDDSENAEDRNSDIDDC